MKLLIAGSRNICPSVSQIEGWIADIPAKVSELVSGGAKGVDLAGEAWAKAHGVPVRQFLPDWSLGKKAGPLRNKAMVDYADAALIVWDGESRGTQSTVNFLKTAGKKFILKILPTPAQRTETALIKAADRVAQTALEYHRTHMPGEKHKWKIKLQE